MTEWYRTTQNYLPFTAEYRFIRPNGKITWIYGQAIPETASDRSVAGYIGTLTDITERRNVEEIKRALEQEKNERTQTPFLFYGFPRISYSLSIITFATQVLENSEPEWLDAKKYATFTGLKILLEKLLNC